jgi:hypothetical protein
MILKRVLHQTSRQGDSFPSTNVELKPPLSAQTDEKGFRGNQLEFKTPLSFQTDEKGFRGNQLHALKLSRCRSRTPDSLLFGVVAAAVPIPTATTAAAGGEQNFCRSKSAGSDLAALLDAGCCVEKCMWTSLQASASSPTLTHLMVRSITHMQARTHNPAYIHARWLCGNVLPLGRSCADDLDEWNAYFPPAASCR